MLGAGRHGILRRAEKLRWERSLWVFFMLDGRNWGIVNIYAKGGNHRHSSLLWLLLSRLICRVSYLKLLTTILVFISLELNI